jgi:thioredoxin reductase (NADPH)
LKFRISTFGFICNLVLVIWNFKEKNMSDQPPSKIATDTPAKIEEHDVIMIGAGPSALAAAIYTTREDIGTVLLEKGVVGGLAAITDQVDNYPGFEEGVTGLDLADKLEKQAERFGADIRYGEVSEIVTHTEDHTILVKTIDDTTYKAKAVLLATGSDYKKIGVPGEEEYYGRGVHYCATCDGAFYRDKKLVVVGGGNSAVQEALFLTRFTTHIDLLVRSSIKASEVLQHELQKFVDEGKITIHLNTVTDEILGKDNKVVKVKATKDGKPVEFTTDGVFVFVGLLPNTDFLKTSAVKLDEVGFILTDQNLMTSIPGVFASGDVRSGATMQIASAVGEGATAALKIREYLEDPTRK